MLDGDHDTWPVVTADLRDMLLRAGVSETTAGHLLAVIAPAAAALERERGAVEAELLWALVVVAADAYQRKQPQRGKLHLPTARRS
jgi:hypothetical protein